MMHDIFIALGIGVIAGILDVIPMVIQKRPRFTIYSVFSQWLFLGLIIPFISWNIEPWIKGLIIGVLGMLPTTITVFYRNRQAVVSTVVFGGLLGVGIALVAEKLMG